MEEEPMDIDDSLPVPQIIERKSTENDAVVVIDADDPPEAPTSSTDAAEDEVVVVDDEDEECVIDLVGKRSCNSECINYACDGGKDMMVAPELCLQYFRVRNAENKRREVCKECYTKALSHYEDLAVQLTKGGSVFDVEVPMRNDMFEIDDSDSENEGKEDEEAYDEECVKFLEKEFTKVLGETLNKYNFYKQVDDGVKKLKERSKPLAQSFKEIDESVKSLRQRLDSVQINLYKQFPVRYDVQEPLDIVADQRDVRKGLRTFEKKKPETPIVVISDNPPVDLPAYGEIVKEPLIVGEIYYATRVMSRGSWVKVRLLESFNEEFRFEDRLVKHLMYKVKVEDKDVTPYFVKGAEIAYSHPSKVRLEVGTRVIARFSFTGITVIPWKKDSFYPGIVGEPPYNYNNHRYLILFDDGYAQYVLHKDVYLIVHASENVWEDINEQNRDFIQKYMRSYPERSMVKLMKGQTVQVEYKGKWVLSTVKDLDASLVQVQFSNTTRMEWIYRGSTRLSPLYEEEKAANNRRQHNLRPIRSTATNTVLVKVVLE